MIVIKLSLDDVETLVHFYDSEDVHDPDVPVFEGGVLRIPYESVPNQDGHGMDEVEVTPFDFMFKASQLGVTAVEVSQ